MSFKKFLEEEKMYTKPGGEDDHTHSFKMGDKKTSMDHGHDHTIEYKDGKPIKTGPGKLDGHIHSI